MGVGVARLDRGLDLFNGRVVDVVVPQFQHGRSVAAAHTRRAQHADLGRIQTAFQRRAQLFGTSQFARQGIAHTDRQRGRRGFVFFDHIEMGVEGRDLIDLGHGQFHFFGQRAQMGGRQMAEFILNQVEIFDQQIAATRAVTQQITDLGPSGINQLASLGCPATFAGGLFPYAFLFVQSHQALLPELTDNLQRRSRWGVLKSDTCSGRNGLFRPKFDPTGDGIFR